MLKRKVWGIDREVLDMIIEVAKSNYPMEYIALLHQEDGVINELHFLPERSRARTMPSSLCT
jgi:proteasome lid subunit RPN8/RPN11